MASGDWLKASANRLQEVLMPFEWQDDSLLLAREAML